MAVRNCSVCGACPCGTTIYEVNGKPYCGLHKPLVSSVKQDSQVLTQQQKLNMANGS